MSQLEDSVKSLRAALDVANENKAVTVDKKAIYKEAKEAYKTENKQ